MGILSSIINTVGGIITNTQNVSAQERINEQNMQYQKDMADLAYQRNLEQWNRENLYNSPAEQMKRLEEAGLNPNLVYGGGATTLSAKSPQYKAPDAHLEAPRIVNPVSADFDIVEAVKNIQGAKNMSLQNELMQQDITSKKVDNAIKIATQDTAVQKQVEELVGMKLTNSGKVLDNQGKTYDNVVKFIEAQNKEFAQPYEKIMIQYKTDIMKNQVDLTEAQANEAAARKLLLDVQTAIAKTEEEARKQGWSWNDKYFYRQFATNFYDLGSVPPIKDMSLEDVGFLLNRFLKGILFGSLSIFK